MFISFNDYALKASSTATAQATVIPTIGLLPAPIKPIISLREWSGAFFIFFVQLKLQIK